MSWLTTIRKSVAKAIDIREAGGALVDDDDWTYRQIGGLDRHPNDLREYAETRLRRIARTFYFTNPVGGSLVDSLVARVIGAGGTFEATNEDVQKEVDRFVTDPDNDLDILLPRLASELLAFGKLVLPIALNPKNGDVKLGYLHPDQVERIIWREGDAKKALAVLQRRPNLADKKILWIVPQREDAYQNRYAPHPALTPDDEPGSVKGKDGNPVVVPDDPSIAKILTEGDIEIGGYAFYERTNCLVGGDGHSIFERVKDEIKAFSDFFFWQLRNAKLQSAFVWDVLLKGANEAKIKERTNQYRQDGPPQPGSILFRNEQEEWEAKGPNLPNAAAVQELVTSSLKLIGLAVGLPGHEMGAEDDVNRSTAKESRSVSLNKAKRFQKELAAILAKWIGYQIDQKVYAGQLPDLMPEDRAVEATLPELDARDEGEVANSLQLAAPALISLLGDGLILKRDARRKAYELLGYDMPDDSEFDAEEKARREDLLSGIAAQMNGRTPPADGMVDPAMMGNGNGRTPPGG